MAVSRAVVRTILCALVVAWAPVGEAEAVKTTQPAEAVAAGTATTQSATEGSPLTVTIAVGPTCPSLVTIDWGDGSAPDTGLKCDGSGSVSATHTYAEEGAATITVVDPTNPSTPLQTEAVTIDDAALTSSGPTSGSAVVGQAVTSPAATFTDANPGATISDFTASIAWGDGSTSAGSMVGGPGGDFSVSDPGGHTYAASGTYNVDVKITDAGGSTIDVQYPMTVSNPSSSSSSTTSSGSSSPSLPKYQATLYGTVVLVRPHLPGTSPVGTVDPGATVTVVVATRQGTVRRTTLTGKTGAYSFANLPPCSPAAGDTCTVSVTAPGSSAIADQASITLPDRPSTTRINLTAGRLSSRFFIAGSVLAPGAIAGVNDVAAGPARPSSDLEVWVEHGNRLEEIYDGLRACRAGRWAGVGSGGKALLCVSTAGNYLLGQVALPGTSGVLASVGPVPTEIVIIRLEATRPGGRYVPVDSARVKLPANTAANNANPPLTIAPPLHEVFPLPTSSGGHSVAGRVIRVRAQPPSAKPVNPVGVASATVVLSIGSGKHLIKRRARTDRSGYYAFFNIPSCPRHGSCDLALVSRHHRVLALRRISVPGLYPSVSAIDLKAPPTAPL